MSESDFVPDDELFEREETRRKSLFDLFKDFMPFFGIGKEQKPLIGRIHNQLQKDANLTVMQLSSLKEELRQELLKNTEDEPLWLSFEAVITPLLRQYTLIEKQLQEPLEPGEQSDTIRSVNDWIERAKMWVTLCSKPTDRISMIEAVVQNNLAFLDCRIDRDLKTVIDYKEHELLLLGLGEEALAIVRSRLDEDLARYIQGLLDLKKQKPADLELQTLSKWRAQTNEARSELFNAALQAIDTVVNAATPTRHAEEQEHLKELIHRIAYLENETHVLVTQLDTRDLSQEVQRQMFESALNLFEDDAHLIHHDLRLTPDLIERIQLILQLLSFLRFKLKNAA